VVDVVKRSPAYFLVPAVVAGLALVVSCGPARGGLESHTSDAAGATTSTVTSTSPAAGTTAASGATTTPTTLSTRRPSLPALPTWAYMLQGDVVAGLHGSEFDLVVMDYSKDGTDDVTQRYTESEMASIGAGGAPRFAVAYLSIGEAEDYRYYFDPSWAGGVRDGRPDGGAPSWVGRTNPDWEGNYKVRYWSEEWQRIVLGYVDKLIDLGFDGAYLDIVDAFEYWSDEANGEGYVLSEADAAERMIDFVGLIAAYARAQDPAFLVIPQNGERILDYDTRGDYLEAIDGMGVEDLFYWERTAVEPGIIAERVSYLDKVLQEGKPVLVVDYVYEGEKDSVVGRFIDKSVAAGFSPYAAYSDRELDEIVAFAGRGQ
jgi:cysteinyl-tRNA synthetase